MHTPDEHDDDTVTVLINGKVHTTWGRYQIDSDFLIPADAWSVTVGLPDGVFPEEIKKGVPVQVKVGADTVLSGRIDATQRNISRKQVSLSMSGRDNAAALVDCASPIFTSRQLGLEEVIANVVRPLGIQSIKIIAESGMRSDKVNVEPGERGWDTLVRAASARGLWPWCEPDGTLVIGGPDYTAEPVATLIMNRNGQGNNLISLNERSSIVGMYSELTVLAQGHAQGKKTQTLIDVDSATFAAALTDDDSDMVESVGSPETGFHALKHVVRDQSVPYFRPQIMVVGDADNLEQVQYRARKAMADARLSGFELIAEVKGHRTESGKLWTPGQRVRIKSEPHNIDQIFFLMGREFTLSRTDGKLTVLRFKEDGIWIPDAFPKKRKAKKHRSRNNKKLEIVDVE
ncbi:phage tail protein [Shigella sonnei]|nr:phage tail protein [Escherichia coli]EFW5532227.1 phage tail protein [Shigella sonnei]EFZ0655789.1 phage tail protein [Shigella sonnei]EFZ2872832.1 phage tail protein [Shigella sonnei]EFZ3697896.1 phage tail protein [Shigella sonnei]